MAIKSIVALTVQLMAADPNVNGVDGNCVITYTNPPTANEQTANAAICAGWVDPAQQRVIAVADLFNLFTPAEQAATVANPAAHLQLLKLMQRGVIDLNSPAATTAFANLVTAGILTAPRSTALLATPGTLVPVP